MYFVYVLMSETTGKRYIGQTENLARRLREHNTPDHNLRKHTSRNRGPWRLVHFETFATRTEAMRRERWLKSGVGRRWLDEEVGRVRHRRTKGGLTAWSQVRPPMAEPGELFQFSKFADRVVYSELSRSSIVLSAIRQGTYDAESSRKVTFPPHSPMQLGVLKKSLCR